MWDAKSTSNIQSADSPFRANSSSLSPSSPPQLLGDGREGAAASGGVSCTAILTGVAIATRISASSGTTRLALAEAPKERRGPDAALRTVRALGLPLLPGADLPPPSPRETRAGVTVGVVAVPLSNDSSGETRDVL